MKLLSSRSAIASAVVDAITSKTTLFDSLSVITIIVSAWSVPDGGNLVIKSIEISVQIRSGIGSGFNRPCCFSLYMVILPYISQFRRNFRTSWLRPGYMNFRLISSLVRSLPRCPERAESYVSWMTWVRSGSKRGSQIRPLQQSRFPLSIEHSTIEIGSPYCSSSCLSPSLTNWRIS